MYMATCDTGTCGSTCLHVDATSAVNVMTYSGETGGAVWLIFKPGDASKLSQWLRGKYPDASPGDIIHQQWVFITDRMEDELLRDTGIHGFRFTQRVGDAVFIPAGAPHQVIKLFVKLTIVPELYLSLQVSNQAPCIKIATDFCSVQCLDETLRISRVWREHGRNDLMQPTAMLWYAWTSLINLSENVKSDTTVPHTVSRTTEHRRARRSEKRRSAAVHKTIKEIQCPHEDCRKPRLFDEAGLRCHMCARSFREMTVAAFSC